MYIHVNNETDKTINVSKKGSWLSVEISQQDNKTLLDAGKHRR